MTNTAAAPRSARAHDHTKPTPLTQLEANFLAAFKHLSPEVQEAFMVLMREMQAS
ncbi:hypothetical protein [Magnetospirillum sp. SS-4]|uniref:hypothetical protein n=1 Tax=Magnetospirillum sp. SS-4 TaxID=2681465 RepID=UPI0015749A21|nr:hypothetical protein [Magnetospirillum sp. SS-4]